MRMFLSRNGLDANSLTKSLSRAQIASHLPPVLGLAKLIRIFISAIASRGFCSYKTCWYDLALNCSP